ncbi:NUDIX domain-containing protein [Streptomyces erythrochromogenes]|uniref:NUDIX hydrolase n=1 Tax=Streptomyces erythrochromogenes TaxID=285574 RepID=UPI0036B72085
MLEKTAESGRTDPSHYADVHLLLRQGDELLMSRRREQPVFPGMWQVPAGLMEDHEPATVAAAREFAEETGAAVDPAHLQLVHLMHHVSAYGGARRIAFFFATDRWTGAIGNPEPEKCTGWVWHKTSSLPAPLPPYLAVALQHIADGILYSEFAWPTTDEGPRGTPAGPMADPVSTVTADRPGYDPRL